MKLFKTIFTLSALLAVVGVQARQMYVGNLNFEDAFRQSGVVQKDTIGAEICIAISDSPYGKFENNQVIYSTPEFLYIDGISQYNAKMHPTLSSKDKYVISYNLNESGFGGNDNNGDIYHPRFIDLYQI